MTPIRGHDPIDAATSADAAELDTEARHGLPAVKQRLDRIFLAWLVGLFGLVAAMAGVVPGILR